MSRLINIQRVDCGRMKEIWRQTLTNQAPTPYSKYGDTYMAGENGEIPNNQNQSKQNPEVPRASNPKKESVPPNPAEQQKQARLRGIWEQWKKDVYGDDPVPVDTKRFVEDAIGKNFGPTGMYKEPEEGAQNTSPEESTPQGGGRGGEGKKPPPPPTTPPEEPDNQEGDGSGGKNQSELNLNEGEIENPILKQRIPEVNEFLKGKVTIEGYAALRKKIVDLEPPDGLTNEQKHRFELDKQKFLGVIAEKLTRAIPADQRGERIRKSLDLQEAIEGEDYDAVDRVIKSIDIDDYNTYAPAISDVVERLQGKGKDHMLEYLLEFGVERIISIADINPKVQYPQFNLYQTQNLDSVTQIARRYDERNGDKGSTMFKKLTDLKTKRYAMHELFRSLKNRENYVKLVTELLRQDGLAFVEKEIVGVSDVQILYEEVLGSSLSFKDGWLNHKDFEAADFEAKSIFSQDAIDMPDVINKKYLEGNYGEGKTATRPLREWEINRALLVGRSLHAMSQRRLTYGVMGDVSKRDVDEMLKSIESEFLARILAPFKLVPERFFSWPTAERWQELFLARLKKRKDGSVDNHKYGYVDDKGKAMGLYGKRQDSLAILDLGITDPKSNSWRGRHIFLKQDSYSTETLPNGDKTPIGFYLDDVKRRAEDQVKKEIEDKNPGISETKVKKMMHSSRDFYKKGQTYKQLKEELFNEAIRVRIADQRLFLGALMRYPDLDDQNKRAIWDNVARRLPSRIAAFFPEETLQLVKKEYDIVDNENDNEQVKMQKRRQALEKWGKLKIKLWRAERARVKADAEMLRTNEKGERVEGPLRELESFYEQAKIDDQDKRIINELISFGLKKVATDENGKEIPVDAKDSKGELIKPKGGLIKITFPFTAFLDDAPKTDWDNLNDEDYDRILVNDHSAFQEGYGKPIGLISNPVAKPEAVVKAFTECFEKIQSPLGVPDAQKRMEPLIDVQLEMGRMNKLAEWFSPVMKILRVPRSEIEKHNLKAAISQGAKDQSDIIDGLAQHDVLSDDPEEADEKGQTQAMRMKEEHEADLKAVLMEYVRLILLLLGPVVGLQFLKIVLPEEVSKSLG